MYPDIETVKQALLKENFISEEDNAAAEAHARDSGEYIDYLIREEILSKPLLGEALAEYYGVPFYNLEAKPLAVEQMQRLPNELARSSRCVFVRENDVAAAVVTDDPTKLDLQSLSAALDGKRIQVAYSLPENITHALAEYRQPLSVRFSDIIEQGDRVAPEIVDEIIADALSHKASDVHFEPLQASDVVVRFRIDGTLHEAGFIPKEYYENILNRIKVESGMRIDEHLSAQDGAFSRTFEGGGTTDLRVSLVPTVEGEKLVLRVLSSYIQNYTLSDLGLSATHRQLLESHSRRPFGMILSVGPTGSGKSTTLYALLKQINASDMNITTIEDPVEYKIPRVNQIQVREQAGLTFARGLRSIVRQDPDVILVGEIRDQETAEISVNAALTGHLLFSTFHANDAATAIPRLIEMDIEPFLLASTLNLIIAQRLVRKICRECRASIPVKADSSAAVFFDTATTLYRGKGCRVCNNTGYDGQTAVFECIEVTPELTDLALTSPSSRELAALAKQQGAITMFEDGLEKVKNGITTIEELLRVVERPIESQRIVQRSPS